MKPLISVIIPNFNHAPYLKQRIDSIPVFRISKQPKITRNIQA